MDPCSLNVQETFSTEAMAPVLVASHVHVVTASTPSIGGVDEARSQDVWS